MNAIREWNNEKINCAELPLIIQTRDDSDWQFFLTFIEMSVSKWCIQSCFQKLSFQRYTESTTGSFKLQPEPIVEYLDSVAEDKLCMTKARSSASPLKWSHVAVEKTVPWDLGRASANQIRHYTTGLMAWQLSHSLVTLSQTMTYHEHASSQGERNPFDHPWLF